jgi:high-affinity nickel permease
MALVDTSDAILMLGAYGWAFIKPIRKLYYNMTIVQVEQQHSIGECSQNGTAPATLSG